MNEQRAVPEFTMVDDPLIARLKGKKTELSERQPRRRFVIPGKGQWLAIVLLLGALGYVWSQNNTLERQLDQNEKQVSALIDQLQASDSEVAAVKQTLLESDKKFSAKLGSQMSRTQSLYERVRQEQAEKQRLVDAALASKADTQQVEKLNQTLKSEAEGIRSGVGEANQKITTVQTEVGGLKEVSAQHRRELDEQKTSLAGNREEIGSVKTDLGAFKKSFERDYFPFEISKNGAIQKVADVGLKLDKANVKGNQFNLEIFINGQRLQKKNRALNEPIYFYVAGQTKPYEVVIQKINKNLVVGYLSAPKKS